MDILLRIVVGMIALAIPFFMMVGLAMIFGAEAIVILLIVALLLVVSLSLGDGVVESYKSWRKGK